ncbi:hypothetical protein AUEXF2481DRAFT_184849 [Aureobasidium subglaciale EXF-2481]|uniref:Uncharacterized protein n=1 Tax=Aureobasidium subglaciale (strain EXF-2481) TaxID=1043005 RepID=A0A074ZMN1_AURSE|nr:uncharacterized protein AUEXF2481DRAFT_184849 [Aureobasidium subglaciale EXF-2481]KAI5194613.1 hypothetical protein E4T38_09515 [Aureobasidium subglaciale]KAI5213782.1 hypothetical protein E4T40_09432 [Aureobasidium subglaciale]KAI5215803.1 hypothetical protein E4T41_09467 [Aureobasidium subglaciale]KAI5253880.1 hypothetical protein E4T46_09422 [Aureobasidium subglaciale]KEQ99601.1 hypothetical protein AUEXF2481DRAFT_184849 [Aureobasidium subglaciale EXF-2481]
MVYGQSTKTNGLSKGARDGIIAAVVIVIAIILSLLGFFLWRNRKLKLTKAIVDAQEAEGIRAWPTKWPTRARPVATAPQTRRHGEAVELAPPEYDTAQPLPTYEPAHPPRVGSESYELTNMPHGHEPARQNV